MRRLDPVNTAVWAGIFLFWPVVLVLIIVFP